MALAIWNCVLLYKQNDYVSEKGFFFQEMFFITELPGGPGKNYLLLRYLTGGKWDFQVANSLLATANFEPCSKWYAR